MFLSSALFWRFGAKDDVINDVIIALNLFCKSEVIFGGEEDPFSTYLLMVFKNRRLECCL
jgi:hypothetical protein